MQQFQMSLTPNRTTPRQYARMTSYRRNGRKVDRVFISFNRWGKVDRTKQIPMADESLDWTHVPAGPKARAYALSDKAIVPMMKSDGFVVDAYMETPKGEPLSALTELREHTIQVAPTAKRDWLIAMGAIKPDPGHLPWTVRLCSDQAGGQFEVVRELASYEAAVLGAGNDEHNRGL